MGLEIQGSKPKGTTGKVLGRLMNSFHTPLYVKYFKGKRLPANCRILDVGCGGGRFLKFLAKKGDGYKLWGLDLAEVMIDLSGQLNKKEIQKGRLKLFMGSVTSIGVNDNSFDLVTAFETVQFWSDPDKAFSEIFRVLDSNGELILINRFPKQGTKWWKIANLKSEMDYRGMFENAGFKNIFIDMEFKRHWIVAKGIKV